MSEWYFWKLLPQRCYQLQHHCAQPSLRRKPFENLIPKAKNPAWRLGAESTESERASKVKEECILLPKNYTRKRENCLQTSELRMSKCWGEEAGAGAFSLSWANPATSGSSPQSQGVGSKKLPGLGHFLLTWGRKKSQLASNSGQRRPLWCQRTRICRTSRS